MSGAKVVVVLSGGGAKAAAHVGALKALDERGITPTQYVATSMGAVIAACFASGLSYSAVLRRITSIAKRDVAAISPSVVLGLFATSLLRADPLRQTIERLVPARQFAELEVPLTVTTVDAKSGELLLLGTGGRTNVSLVDALYASCALPLYYPPGRVDNRDCIDGGMRAVLPLDVAAKFDPDIAFAVDVGPSLRAEPPERDSQIPALVRAHGDAMRVLMAAQAEEAIARWRSNKMPLVLITPTHRQQATFAVGSVVTYVEEGYRAAIRALDRWVSPHAGGADCQQPA
ncbi:MAG: patatin-like phospholipase family protein [Gemmatimonadota bacterium]|nr:MAG: patatin-like phospholipase family protein [Gemmatimonadota bacterium]